VCFSSGGLTQRGLLVRRWWPEREIVAVADSAYASLRLLASCRRFLPRPVTFVTRLRLDAALYDPAPPRRAGQLGRPRLKGERLPNLSILAEDPSTTAGTAMTLTISPMVGEPTPSLPTLPEQTP
jgi:hypothetical protein